jgi:putative sigma-54 modulation protein
LDFEIIGRHFDVTSEMKSYVDSRLSKLPKFFGRIHGLRAILALDGDVYQAEFIANLVKGDTVVAKAHERDVYAAVDAACDKLESQFRRYKDKLREHRVKIEAEEGVSAPVEEGQEEIL